MNKFAKVFLILFIFLIIVSGVFVFFNYHNSSSEPKPEAEDKFYVMYNDVVLENNTNLILTFNQKNVFKYGYGGTTERVGCVVKMAPNFEKDFVFSVDGQERYFSGIQDLLPAFDLTITTSSITFNPVEEFSLLTVLQALFPESEVEIPKLEPVDFYYVMEVWSEDMSEKIVLNLSFGTSEVTGVVLESDIYF